MPSGPSPGERRLRVAGRAGSKAPRAARAARAEPPSARARSISGRARGRMRRAATEAASPASRASTAERRRAAREGARAATCAGNVAPRSTERALGEDRGRSVSEAVCHDLMPPGARRRPADATPGPRARSTPILQDRSATIAEAQLPGAVAPREHGRVARSRGTSPREVRGASRRHAGRCALGQGADPLSAPSSRRAIRLFARRDARRPNICARRLLGSRRVAGRADPPARRSRAAAAAGRCLRGPAAPVASNRDRVLPRRWRR